MGSRRKRGRFLTIMWQSVRQIVKAVGKSAKSIVSKPRENPSSKERYSWTSSFMGLSNALNRGKKRPYANAERGFVLPSVILLLMIAGLVVGTMLSTSSNRAKQVIADRSNQAMVNSASPAIDRGKAKLEFLFNRDPRFPGGLPGDSLLEGMLLNTAAPVQNPNPYVFSDETRLDINGDNTLDNAWSFQQDVDNDGQTETVAYSILAGTNAIEPLTNATITRTSSDATKAKNLVVRAGPVTMTQPGSGGCGGVIAAATAVNDQGGWDAINSATVKRSFQVTGVVINASNDQANRTVATLELQQDRQADLGNKWGAWFRNDLHIFPGPQFNWNGAMHTEGNLFATTTSGFNSYLISAPTSCLYRKENSEVTVAGNLDGTIVLPGTPYLAQVSAGSLRDNDFSGTTSWAIHGVSGASSQFSLSSGSDSVATTVATPDLIALDPIVLQTQDLSQSRSSTLANGTAARNTTWSGSLPVAGGRIFNSSAKAPYVDDTYRADDRYGPKSRYSANIPASPAVLPTVGTTIASTDPYFSQLSTLTNTTPESNGLDGYWERRAWAEGLRIIVGQRLELGNAYDWKRTTGDTISPDPLYPPTTANLTRTHEQRQRKSLRDNLAAVQSAAIYHAKGTGGFFKACLALTAHPGTQQTIANSLNFINFPGTTTLQTDFLTGNGTNGWEFDPPAPDATTFTAKLAAGKPLLKALTNLAYFAGDPNGAFPPQQYSGTNTVVGNVVHPYPNLTMWGDFSNLRRVITNLNSGTAYANLSLADQITLQTASCTMGMLAYDLEGVKASYTAALSGNGDVVNINSLGRTLFTLMDGIVSTSNPEIALDTSTPANAILCTSKTATNCTGLATYSPNYYKNINSDQWIQALAILQGSTTDPLVVYGKQILSQIQNYQQIRRDRNLGFARATTPVTTTLTPTTAIPMNNPSATPYSGAPSGVLPAGRYTISNGVLPPSNTTAVASGQLFRVFCDPDLFVMGTGTGVTPVTATTSPYFNRLALAQAFCSPSEAFLPKYPSLFYLFPVVDHTQNGSLASNVPSSSGTALYDEGFIATQPGTGVNAEIYVADAYINGATVNGSTTSVAYRAVQGGTAGISDLINSTVSSNQVVVNPRTRTGGTNNWQLPFTTTIAGRVNIINDTSTISTSTPVALSFLDKGIFNGREMMGVRVLDVDLDLLRTTTTNLTADAWLPYTGIVYAFREDALREDGIARPAAGAWSSCDSATEIVTATCRMDAFTPKDPPNNPITGISPKPVDFYADPDRRPHGFRLRNGADIRRPSAPSTSELNGLSFISDNPVYVMADANNAFNLHNSTSTGTRIEEFTTILADDWSNFYARTGLNGNFARVGDTWRPVEIIADAVSVIPRSFVDGSIADGIVRTNCTGNSSPSYCSLNGPNDANLINIQWVREDNSISNAVTGNLLPIIISKDADLMYCKVTSNGSLSPALPNGCTPTAGINYSLQAYGRESTPKTYLGFTDGKNPADGVNGTRMNFTVVSGLTPARAGNDYGGLHNFPRFLNDWSSQNLFLTGSFIQLNFSTSATGPFDQDSWEPTGAASPLGTGVNENINYYGAPIRRWGYDVGLQYAPAGAVAKRFSTPSNIKSEFYTTLPIDDPYVKRLRCSTTTGSQIDPLATCP